MDTIEMHDATGSGQATTGAEERLSSLIGDHSVTDARRESLRLAIEAGADDATLATLLAASRIARSETIVLPAGRFEHLSRGRGWARKGRGDTVEWGERVTGGYRVGPGRWMVGSTDGFKRKDSVEWIVRHISVGSAVWTMAD